MASEHVRMMNSSAVTPEALAREGVVFVDFWAPWCGPCRMLAPVIDQLADEFHGQAVIGKVNIDEEEQAAVSYGIASIPTMIIFKNGKEVDRLVGARPFPQLADALRKHL